MGRIIDLSLTIEDNMPAHKLFQRPIYTVHMSHESALRRTTSASPGDAMTFQTNFIGMLDHVGTHVDAFRHVESQRDRHRRDAARTLHGQGRVFRPAPYP